MYNYFMLIGLVNDMKIKGESAILTIKINDELKRVDGTWNSNLIPVKCDLVLNNIHIGDMVAVKGRIKIVDGAIVLAGERILGIQRNYDTKTVIETDDCVFEKKNGGTK